MKADIMPEQNVSYMRRTAPLALSFFLSSLAGNCYRVMAILALCGSEFDIFRYLNQFLEICLAWFLPFILFAIPAGHAADHLPKRYLCMLTSFLRCILLLFGVRLLLDADSAGGWFGILSVIFAESAISVFFVSAAKGILPESFPETLFCKASGHCYSARIWGAIFGAILPVFLLKQSGAALFGMWSVPLTASLLALFFSWLIILSISSIQRRRELGYTYSKAIRRGIRGLMHKNGMFAAALGDMAFIGIGIAIQPLLVLFSYFGLGVYATSDLLILPFVSLIGVAVGYLLCGFFSGRKVQLGLVPLGALGMLIFLCLLIGCPRETSIINVIRPVHFSMTISFAACIYTFCAGVSAGLFCLPLRTFLLMRIPSESLGIAISIKNAVTVLFAMAAALLTLLATLGRCDKITTLPPRIHRLTGFMPDISPVTLLIVFGLVIFILTVFSLWMLPNFMLRFLVLTLGNSLYHLRIKGAEHIPSHGGAMILCNHVSIIDSIILSACTSRQIRFLLHEDYYQNPLIGILARLTGFFRIPNSAKLSSMANVFRDVRKYLKNGGVVCVFPEGRITRNGLMGKLQNSYRAMLPKDQEIPVIPANISYAWGSVFSYYSGKLQFRIPKELPFFAAVTFGRPLPGKPDAFTVRQRIEELSAEAGMEARPHERTLHHTLALRAKRHPFQVIMADQDGSSLTNYVLFIKSVLISREIRKMTSSDSRYAGILLPNCTASAVSMMSILLADKTPCPLNYTVSQNILDLSIKKADIRLILTSKAFLEKVHLAYDPERMIFLEDLWSRISRWKAFMIQMCFWLIPRREFTNIIAPVSFDSSDAPAALLFSSGSTGTPKGIILTQHNILSNVYAMQHALCISHEDRVLGNLPLFHSFGLTTCFWMPVFCGVKVVYVPNPLDSTAVCNVLAKESITILLATPSFMQKYLHYAKNNEFKTVRIAITGAEKLRSDIAEQFRRKTNGRLTIVEGYGCTELSPLVSFNLNQDIHNTGALAGKEGSIGIALENISVKIVDPLSFEPVGPDTEGLLFVKGPNVMQGYIGERELTDKVMYEGYYNTGDIARMDESGYIQICGRLSRFSKIAGEMVPHEMVEKIINELCGKRVVAVGGKPDPVKGEVLLVLYTPEMKLTPEQIVDQLRERSISNLWIPKVRDFYPVEKLPLLGSGKLDLSVLRRIGEQLAAKEKEQK